MTISRREVRTAVMRAIYAATINGEAAGEMRVRLGGMSPSARQREALDDPQTVELLGLFDLWHSDIERRAEEAYGAPLSAMTDVERAIIGGGAAELLSPNGAPIGVIIDEAVEMAKTYGSDGGAALVNAVLDKIATLESPPPEAVRPPSPLPSLPQDDD